MAVVLLDNNPWKAVNKNVNWKRKPPAETVRLFVSSETEKLSIITVSKKRAEQAIYDYETKGCKVLHPGYTRKGKPGQPPEKEYAKNPRPVKKQNGMARVVVNLATGELFPSSAQAALDAGTSAPTIAKACKTAGLVKGVRYKYATEQEIKEGYTGELIPPKL